jgi:hypothetical protein
MIAVTACKSRNAHQQSEVQNADGNKLELEKTADFKPVFIPGPSTFVYKTKADYDSLVPIILSDDKKTIVSFPHPKDLKIANELTLPTRLNNNYLLDNRGIGENVAFLKLTYKEYSELNVPPSVSEHFNLIIDDNPLTELCDCGNRDAIPDPVFLLNSLIDKKQLRTSCKTIK